MILITQDEAFKLRELGSGKYVHKSHSRHPKYYLTENPDKLKQLEEYRKSKVSWSM